MDSTKLLLIEDDEKFCRLLRDYLAPLGYQVEASHDGRDGLALAQTGTYAAVILDVMLPRMSGFDILRELRRTSQVPVLMLTALGDEVDRIAGLEIGADDYLPKTFSTRELLARLRSVLRRSSITAAGRARILYGVADQVRDRAFEQRWLSPHGQFGGDADVKNHAGAVFPRDHLRNRLGDVDWHQCDRAVGQFRPGVLQQVVSQPAQCVNVVLEIAQVAAFRILHARIQDLERDLHPAERRPQLMGGVTEKALLAGDERAQPHGHSLDRS